MPKSPVGSPQNQCMSARAGEFESLRCGRAPYGLICALPRVNPSARYRRLRGHVRSMRARTRERRTRVRRREHEIAILGVVRRPASLRSSASDAHRLRPSTPCSWALHAPRALCSKLALVQPSTLDAHEWTACDDARVGLRATSRGSRIPHAGPKTVAPAGASARPAQRRLERARRRRRRRRRSRRSRSPLVVAGSPRRQRPGRSGGRRGSRRREARQGQCRGAP